MCVHRCVHMSVYVCSQTDARVLRSSSVLAERPFQPPPVLLDFQDLCSALNCRAATLGRVANPALCVHIPALWEGVLGSPLGARLSPAPRPTESSALAAPSTLQPSRTAVPCVASTSQCSSHWERVEASMSLPLLQDGTLVLPGGPQFCGCSNRTASLAPVPAKSHRSVLRQDGGTELPGDNVAHWCLGQSKVL